MTKTLTKEKPILFGKHMIAAIMSGTKSATRRAFKWPELKREQFWIPESLTFVDGKAQCRMLGDGESNIINIPCPYGHVGDRLFVRETTRRRETQTGECMIVYRADNARRIIPRPHNWNTPSYWIAPPRMPRFSARIILTVTSISLDPLHSITKQQAIAEGIEQVGGTDALPRWKDYSRPDAFTLNPIVSFATLWDSRASKHHRDRMWQFNPLVWAIEFDVTSVDG